MNALATPERSKIRRPLFEGGRLRCPHDGKLHDVLTYKRFDLPNEFESQLNQVLRCTSCGHVFSPHLNDEEMRMIEQ
jgi:uncharacterized Zn finger protein